MVIPDLIGYGVLKTERDYIIPVHMRAEQTGLPCLCLSMEHTLASSASVALPGGESALHGLHSLITHLACWDAQSLTQTHS